MSQRKLAVFVEGQTESIFVKQLLVEIAGEKNISFSVISNPKMIRLTNDATQDENKYFVLIVDCHGDDSVKTRILENRNGLIKNNYELVIGLRDIHPIAREKIPQLKLGMKTGVPTKDLQIEICLAKMEVEAWFLQEETHYQKVDARLTNEFIVNNIGFDPSSDCAEDLDSPAELLKSIYQLVGKSYTKKSANVQRTVDSLDYEEVYTILPDKLEYFEKFLCHVDGFLE